MVLSYDFSGKTINTYSHPEGMKAIAQIIPLVADLPAAREAGRFFFVLSNNVLLILSSHK
jgi:hypothetical protein